MLQARVETFSPLVLGALPAFLAAAGCCCPVTRQKGKGARYLRPCRAKALLPVYREMAIWGGEHLFDEGKERTNWPADWVLATFDPEQFNLEQQSRAARNRTTAARAIGKRCGRCEFNRLAHAHLRDGHFPRRDQTLQRE